MYVIFLCTVPTPSVNLVNHNTTMTVGQALVLECLVTTVRGVNSPVTIVWNKSDSVEVRRKDNVGTFQINYNSAEYKDFFTIPLLTTDDNDVSYECIVIISDVQSGDMLTLRLNGKCLNYVRMYLCIRLSLLCSKTSFWDFPKFNAFYCHIITYVIYSIINFS